MMPLRLYHKVIQQSQNSLFGLHEMAWVGTKSIALHLMLASDLANKKTNTVSEFLILRVKTRALAQIKKSSKYYQNCE